MYVCMYRENAIMRYVFVRLDVPTAVFMYIQICIASFSLPKTWNHPSSVVLCFVFLMSFSIIEIHPGKPL
jgi:hypothetical protein